MKLNYLRLALGLLCASAGFARAEMVAHHLDGYEQPKGAIAFLGCVYTYQEIFLKDTHTYLGRNTLFNRENDPSEAVEGAVGEILKSAKTYNVPLETIELPANYKSWVVKQIVKKQIDPGFLAKLCGAKPYALIATVDRYGVFPFEVHMRIVDQGKYADYFGIPPVMEYEGSTVHMRHLRKVVAVSFYLFSVKDGKLVWQANAVETSENSFIHKFTGIARQCTDQIFRRLLKI